MDCKKSKWDYNRLRSFTIGFRVTPEENQQINAYVRMCGLTKQDYLTSLMLQKNVEIVPNPRLYRRLATEIRDLTAELKRLEDATEVSSETEYRLDFLTMILERLRGK